MKAETKMYKHIFLSIFIILNCSFATSNEILSPSMQLRKLSMDLRSVFPSAAEYEELKSIPESEHEKFFQYKINQYMKSKNYVNKMRYRLSELIWLDKPSNFLHIDSSLVETTTQNLFAEIFTENKSWDSILTEQKYKIYLDSTYYNIERTDFFNNIFPELRQFEDETFKPAASNSKKESTRYHFQNHDESEEYNYELNFLNLKANTEEQKKQLAGVLSSPAFFSRFTNSTTNQNRKRAAAIFRVFLCDDMQSAAPIIEDNSDLISVIFADKQQNKGKKLVRDAHSSDPACQSCHSKLDPLGKAYSTSSSMISKNPVSSKLIYNDKNGTRQTIHFEGLAGLAKVITEQEKYAECQVEHIWNWFIGKDILLTPERKEELVKSFNSLDRRANSFIAHMLMQKEYKTLKQSSNLQVNLNHVKPILQKCDMCHQETRKAPNFLKFPIGGDPKEHQTWLKGISKSLDLHGNGKNADMPPADKTSWNLSNNDRALIMQWLEQGAKDYNAKASIEENFAKQHFSFNRKKILAKTDSKNTAQARFDYNFSKLITGHDLLLELNSIFSHPLRIENEKSKNKEFYDNELHEHTHFNTSTTYRCSELSRLNGNLAIRSTKDGKLNYSDINLQYLQLVQNCVELLVKDSISGLHTRPVVYNLQSKKNKNISYYIPYVMDKTFEKLYVNTLNEDELRKAIYEHVNYNNFNAHEDLEIIIHHFAQQLLPHIDFLDINNLVKLQRINLALKERIKNKKNIKNAEVFSWIIIMLIANHDFLSY